MYTLVSEVLLAFTQSEYPTSEDLGYVEVCVELLQAPAGGLECDILVDLGFQDSAQAGTVYHIFMKKLIPFFYPVNGEDYSPVVDPLEVLFVAGFAGQGPTSCANISILDDFALEGPHSFMVAISDFEFVGAIPGTARIFMETPSSASVIIEDNEGA